MCIWIKIKKQDQIYSIFAHYGLIFSPYTYLKLQPGYWDINQSILYPLSVPTNSTMWYKAEIHNEMSWFLCIFAYQTVWLHTFTRRFIPLWHQPSALLKCPWQRVWSCIHTKLKLRQWKKHFCFKVLLNLLNHDTKSMKWFLCLNLY